MFPKIITAVAKRKIERGELLSENDFSLPIENLIQTLSDGKFFRVVFIKRTTGERRVMRARRGVTKYLRGGKLPYDPIEKGLMTVFDLDKKAYRMVSLDAIVELHHHGKVERFDVRKEAA